MNHEIALEEEFARAALKRATWGRVLAYFKPHAKQLTIALVCEATWVLSMLLDPHLIKVALNGPLPAGDVSATLVLSAWLIANIVGRALLTRYELDLFWPDGEWMLSE